jgi:multisubunit Na+/H+ antiporter MnhE subunit
VTSPVGSGKWARRGLEALVWWAACLGVWLVSLSALSGGEILVATVASLGPAVLAVVVRETAGNTWSLRRVRPDRRLPGRLGAVALLPVVLVADTIQALGSVPARHQGRFRRVRVTDARGDAPDNRGRRAVATLAVSVTPGSVVADIDPETGEALVHVLSEHGPDMVGMATR